MDLATLIGSILGISAIVIGQVLEGGSIGQLFQLTGGLIVLGGTLGAVMVSTPWEDLMLALSQLALVFQDTELNLNPVIEEIYECAMTARKDGLLAIESVRAKVKDPLFRKTIKYVVDGFEPNTVKEIVDAEIHRQFEEEERAAQVFEQAGGFAPTIGIIGAVLGLIHVMSKLDDPSKIGEGIAVAFIATLYGVGLANLILLPWSNKIKRKAEIRMLGREVVKMGVIGIQEGLNPGFLKEKLEVYAADLNRQKTGAKTA